MGYIVPFLTISSILIDVCFSNLIFIGAIFNSYNYWYLLSYSNQFTLHYSILLLIFIYAFNWTIPLIDFYWLLITYYSLFFFSNFTFFIPIFLDFFLIFSTFFFKGPINSIEVFIGFNPCYPILFINFFSLFFQIQLIIFSFIYYLFLSTIIVIFISFLSITIYHIIIF